MIYCELYKESSSDKTMKKKKEIMKGRFCPCCHVLCPTPQFFPMKMSLDNTVDVFYSHKATGTTLWK